MTFAAPQMLWLLLVIPPALIAFFWWSARVRQKLMAQFIQARLLPGLIAGVSPTRRKVRAILFILAVICLILALARPQWGYDLEEVSQRGLDIVIAIDTSKSMLAEDIAPNRLARAKLAALDLAQQAKSDRLGLVAFAGSAFLECPLTIDDSAFRQSVNALDVNTISEGGTAIADAIDTALKAFKEGDTHKVLVLFTDGEDNDDETAALRAAESAAKVGLKIFTVGIGTAQGELIRIKGENGQQDFIRDENGNVVKSHLNEKLLQDIAAATKGSYLPLRGANTIDALYQQGLAPLPKEDSKEAWMKRAHERYHWPLAIAIVLLIAETFFPERRPARKRTGNKTSAVRAPAAATVVAFCLFATCAQASPSTAMHDYKAGKFPAAQKEFERLAEADKKGDARFIFNAGDAAYRSTNYDTALKYFTDALASRDVKLQQKAYFNIGNTQFRMGQLGKDLDEIQKHWEEAIKSYQSAVSLDKTDKDAAYNLEFAKHGVEQIKQLREAARQAKQAADAATRQRNYHQALQIMQALLQNNPLGKQFEEFTKKLQNIDAIANPPSQP